MEAEAAIIIVQKLAKKSLAAKTKQMDDLKKETVKKDKMIENLEEKVKEKDKLFANIQFKLSTIQTDISQTTIPLIHPTTFVNLKMDGLRPNSRQEPEKVVGQNDDDDAGIVELDDMDKDEEEINKEIDEHVDFTTIEEQSDTETQDTSDNPNEFIDSEKEFMEIEMNSEIMKDVKKEAQHNTIGNGCQKVKISCSEDDQTIEKQEESEATDKEHKDDAEMERDKNRVNIDNSINSSKKCKSLFDKSTEKCQTKLQFSDKQEEGQIARDSNATETTGIDPFDCISKQIDDLLTGINDSPEKYPNNDITFQPSFDEADVIQEPEETERAPEVGMKRSISGFDSDGPAKKKVRSKRYKCGECEGCRRLDCGKCQFCEDKPRNGGEGKLRQKCRERKCGAMSK